MRLLKSFGKFYACCFVIMYVLGTIDFYVAKSTNHTVFSFIVASYIDGGSRTYIGFGYYIYSPNELLFDDIPNYVRILHDYTPSGHEKSVRHGWEVYAWPVFEVPVIGRSLFRKSYVHRYYGMTGYRDYDTAKHVERADIDDDYLENDFYFVISLLAVLFFWREYARLANLYSHIRAYFKRRKSGQNPV